MAKRIEYPPSDCIKVVTTGLNSVQLEDNEEVEWHISYGLNGTKQVYGYTIRRKNEKGEEVSGFWISYKELVNI